MTYLQLPGAILRTACALILALSAALPAAARQGEPPPSWRLSILPEAEVGRLDLPPVDATALLAEDEKADPGPGPLRFASAWDGLVTPETHGTWEEAPGGGRLWRLRVSSGGATDLGFGFTRFRLPEGATLHVVAEEEAYYQGPYRDDDATAGQLWTPVVPGGAAAVELFVPEAARGDLELELSRVGRGYRNLFKRAGDPVPRSGACNIDVACPEGNDWRAQIDSVALWAFGADLMCTGTMIMDVPRTYRPWFLTADHCGIDAGNAHSVVVYWNFQASVCDRARDGSLDQNQTGAAFRAGHRHSDFTLVELSDDPEPAFGVFFSGWDRSDQPPAGSAGIHHPSNDEKAICFNDDALQQIDSCVGPGRDTHWLVDNWEAGTTEGGSSGSGLWDPESGLLVGTLSGGDAACGNQLLDCYGRFGVQWDREAATDQQLAHWLDPHGTGNTSVTGSYAGTLMRYASHQAEDACAAGFGDGNAIWEPGEEVVLAVEVWASGSLTGVRGTLASLTAGVRILDGQAEWPDLAQGIPAMSEPPHFRIALDESLPCFQEAEFLLRVTSDTGGPFEIFFTEMVGDPFLPNVPVTIVDQATVASRLDIESDDLVEDLEVWVLIDHSWVGDVSIRLRSPTSTEAVLLARPGHPATTTGCSDRNMEITFADDAATDLEDHCQRTDPWYSGRALPLAPLSTFRGDPIGGGWMLRVTDDAAGDQGVIRDWRLIPTPAAPGNCVVCMGSPCPGRVFAERDLMVRRGEDPATVALSFPPPPSACALGVQVRAAASARPAAGQGAFPDDPPFENVTSEDLDPGPGFSHLPPSGAVFYLVVEDLPGGLPGPSGHYGR